MKMRFVFWSLFFLLFYNSASNGQDWPVYKGNLFLTGNNDELIVKNKNIKWVFRAKTTLFNPIVSDSMVYLVDRKARLYALDEQTGRQIWTQDLLALSKRFNRTARVAGKIKTPVIRGRYLVITDATVIYALDKKTGEVLWARTAWLEESTPSTMGQRGRRSSIDGIYSEATIHGSEILYGTRNIFISRNLKNGHLNWNRNDIKSYSGFPSFYSDYIFTQSMDYSAGKYNIHCLKLNTGKEIWKTTLENPFKIFSPVVYRGRVYLPNGKKLYALNLESGKIEKVFEFSGIITSNPGFTDEEIIFTLDNRSLVSINPETGKINAKISSEPQSSPRFVAIREQVYVTQNYKKERGGKPTTFARARAYDRTNPQKPLWSFLAPFPGSASQPSASGGILFLPAGNYLYALGSKRKVTIGEGDGGSIQIEKTDEKGNQITQTTDEESFIKTVNPPPPAKPQPPETRPYQVELESPEGNPISGEVEIIHHKGGEEVSRTRAKIGPGGGTLELPRIPEGSLDDEWVEVIAESPGRLPETIRPEPGDKGGKLKLETPEPGRGIVMEAIRFETNSAHLKRESIRSLEATVRLLKQNQSIKIEIRGHTDSQGDDNYNMRLSHRRADAVRDFLIKHGIDPVRLRSKGFGETKPIGDNKTPEGRARNRRTEFFILK